MTRVRTWAILICLVLWKIYGIVAWTAVSGKSATFDEPSHAVIGWFMQHGDFRLSPDVPPLWEYWISLPLGRSAIQYDSASPEYQNILPGIPECRWVRDVLYRTPGNDGVAIVLECRAMALILAMALGILISAWAWKLAGPVAAVATTMLWALDPNLLGHGPLAKNDIAITLAYAWLGFALWSGGTRLTWRSAASLCLAIAVAPGIKLSGIVFLPVATVVLVIRAMFWQPWPVLGAILSRRLSRLAGVFVLIFAAGVLSYILLWACYGFRFKAGPDDLRLDTDAIAATLRSRMAAEGQSDLGMNCLETARRDHLLPEAWIAGYYYTKISALRDGGYLLGQNYLGGKWSFFPLAFVFKEPLATLAALLIALVVAFGAVRQHRFRGNFAAQWAAISLAVPAGIYIAAALSASINLGLRYLFAIYPFLFIAAGWALSSIWADGRIYRALLLVLAAGLALETAAAYPNFISFFNVACGGSRGSMALLSDSNLDWGQDLPLLAQWQAEHPRDNLYLIYFGLCEPSAYHIRATRLRGRFNLDPYPRLPTTPGVVAISVTALQTGHTGDFANNFRDRTPDAVLGGSIYLFRYP